MAGKGRLPESRLDMRSWKIRRWGDRVASAGDRAFWQFLEKLNIHWIYNSGILVPRYLLKKIKTHGPHKASYTDICCSVAESCPTLCNLREMQHVRLPCPQVFISALFIIAINKKGKQPNFKWISISTECNITESKKKKKDWTTHTQNSMEKSQKYIHSGRKCKSVLRCVMYDSLPPSGL